MQDFRFTQRNHYETTEIYRAEAWPLRKEEERLMQKMDIWMLRELIGISEAKEVE